MREEIRYREEQVGATRAQVESEAARKTKKVSHTIPLRCCPAVRAYKVGQISTMFCRR